MRWEAELEALGSGAIAVDHPVALALGLCAAALLLAAALLRGPLRVRVPGTSGRTRIPFDAPWWLSACLRCTALAFVVLALAGPVALIPKNPVGGSGIDLVVALDASGSVRETWIGGISQSS